MGIGGGLMQRQMANILSCHTTNYKKAKPEVMHTKTRQHTDTVASMLLNNVHTNVRGKREVQLKKKGTSRTRRLWENILLSQLK